MNKVKWLLIGILLAILWLEDDDGTDEPDISKDAIGFLGFKPEED